MPPILAALRDLPLDTPLTPIHSSPSLDDVVCSTPVTPLVDGEGPLPPEALVEPETTPSRIGRFNVIKRLGSGGMGVVYAAYDPDLDRKVALKVLRTKVGSQSKQEKARQRLLREAQAMAKLSHPNVVAIYDVGSVGDQVFLAMEFVKGVTLTKWLQSAEGPEGPRRRHWREVLTVFIQAGRGLSAAHRAGIIHRDFKPDNVMIDADSRVRVGDFGLARADGGLGPLRPDTYAEAIKSMAAQSSMLDMRITRTGGMTGTPAYMAPEQYLGQSTDGRTDQFSFCVALYEGLYGQRPFVGDRVSVVREAVIAGRVQDIPKDIEIPPWLRKIVLRGLSVRPADRYRSMDDLLTRLSEEVLPRSRRRLVLAAVAGAATLAVGGMVAAALSRPLPQAAALACEFPDLGWDEGRRQSVGQALTARPGGATFGRAAAAALDSYADGLKHRYTETCRAVQAGEQDPLAEAREACLERRRSAFAGLARALAGASGAALDRAGTALERLPQPDDCDDPRRLAGFSALPPDPDARAQVRRLRERLDEAAALLALGDAGSALAAVRPVAVEAQTDDYLPLQAKALYLQGAIERELGSVEAAERNLLAALWAAEASRHDEVVVDSLVLLLEVESEDLARHGEARRLWPRISAALRRLADDGRREAVAQGRYGRALLREGDAQAAHDQLSSALRTGERALGRGHSRLLAILLDLAAACQRTGRVDEATQYVERALQLAQSSLPPGHPDRARAIAGAGDLARFQGKPEAARAHYDQALGILERAYGQDHSDMSPVLLGRGLAAAAEQRWEAAAADLRRAAAAWERLHGPEHPRLVEPLTGLCAVDSALGEHEPALAACRRALALSERAGTPAQTALTRFALARARWADAEARGPVDPELRAQIVRIAKQAQDEAERAGEAQLVGSIGQWVAGRRQAAP